MLFIVDKRICLLRHEIEHMSLLKESQPNRYDGLEVEGKVVRGNNGEFSWMQDKDNG